AGPGSPERELHGCVARRRGDTAGPRAGRGGTVAQHLVFVGLGFGGLYTLRQLLGSLPDDSHITAIDARERFVFTPLLYEYLVGELEPDVVAPPFETLLPDDRVDLVQAEVVDLDVRARWVQLDDGRVIDFDTLVVAPGSVAAFHGVPGVQEHAIPFYTFDDAERL